MKKQYTVHIRYTRSTTIDVDCELPAQAIEEAKQQFMDTFGHDNDEVTAYITDVAPSKSKYGPGIRFHHDQCDIERLGVGVAKRTPSDSGVGWWLFTNMTEDEARRALERDGMSLEGPRCHHEHDCCGCGFLRPAVFRRVGKRVLVTQSFGRNI